VAARVRSFAGAALCALASLATAQAPVPAPDRCNNCGTIADIRQSTAKTTWTPLGSAVPGTGAGDYSGQPGRVTATYQIGPELKNQGMVLLGSAGGGNYARRSDDAQVSRWDLSVKMDVGAMRSVSIGYEPPFRIGDRVRVFGTQLELIQP
jgi:hypothetical protein